VSHARRRPDSVLRAAVAPANLLAVAFAALLVRGRLFAAAVVLLCLLPGYVFGPGNEMTMRVGVAPLAVVAVTAAAALLAPAAGRPARWIRRAGLVACAVLAATGSAMEASLLVTHAPWPASRDCSLPEAARRSVFTGATDWSHYVVRWPDASLRAWLAEPAPRRLEREALARCCRRAAPDVPRRGQEPRRPWRSPRAGRGGRPGSAGI
jgi:hypothetical protein